MELVGEAHDLLASLFDFGYFAGNFFDEFLGFAGLVFERLVHFLARLVKTFVEGATHVFHLVGEKFEEVLVLGLAFLPGFENRKSDKADEESDN